MLQKSISSTAKESLSATMFVVTTSLRGSAKYFHGVLPPQPTQAAILNEQVHRHNYQSSKQNSEINVLKWPGFKIQNLVHIQPCWVI